MTDLGTHRGGSNSYALGINASGQVVGFADTGPGVIVYRGDPAFLYSNGTMADLNTLVDPVSGWNLEEATPSTILDELSAMAQTPVGRRMPFPDALPEPSTLVLFGIGAVSLLAYAWRRRRKTA